MHLLRNDGRYRALVDSLLSYLKTSDTRDIEAIKKITTAFVKLLMPYVIKDMKSLNKEDFKNIVLIRP